MKKINLSVVSLLIVVAVSSIQTANARLDILNSRAPCAETPENMDTCQSFILGFLKGALLTDIAIIKSLDEQAKETFAERAIKTRLNKRNESPTALAGFCLPEKKTLIEISEETLDNVKTAPVDSHELARAVYNSLKKDYPC